MRLEETVLRDPLRELEKLVFRCVKCGKCRSVCPVFQAVGREPAVARGKLAIIEAAVVNPKGFSTKELERVLSLCLLCGRCTENCPNGAKPKEAVERARGVFGGGHGMQFLKRKISRILSLERKRKDSMARALAAVQRIVMDHGGYGRGLVLRLLNMAWVPKIQMPPFLERDLTRGMKTHGRRAVGLFVGCSIHYLAPQVGEAAVGILDALGFEVEIPKEQGCCGLMSHAMGDEERAKFLARRFVEIFGEKKWEAIVVPCASCAFHLSRGVVSLLKGTELEKKAEELSARTFEMSSFLASSGLPGILKTNVGKRQRPTVTYHDPCHMWVELGVRKEPRALLEGLSLYDYREMEGADLCCGMGGSFRMFHPGISRAISRRKLKAVKNAKVQFLTTTCMGCWLQLRDVLSSEQVSTSVVHLAELIWDEMKTRDLASHPQEGGPEGKQEIADG